MPGLSRELGGSQVEALLPTGMAALSLCNQEKDNPKPGLEDSGKAPLPYVGAQIYSKFLAGYAGLLQNGLKIYSKFLAGYAGLLQNGPKIYSKFLAGYAVSLQNGAKMYSKFLAVYAV